MIWIIYLLLIANGVQFGAHIAKNGAIRRLTALNRALLDGAARRLMDDVKPELSAALERLGQDAQ